MKKIGGIFLAVLTFFASTLNVFAQAIEEVVEEKTQTINKEDYESLKEEVEKKVFDLNEQDDEYVYDYEISILEEKEEVTITETKKVTSEQKFTSESEAKKYYDEYELEDSWKQGELTITSNNEDIVVNGDEITMTCQEATCQEEIAALEAALNEYQELEVTSKKTNATNDKKTIVYQVDGKTQELHVEDALRIIATLNPEVEGYTLIRNEMVLVKEAMVDVKTFEDIVGTKKYETYAEAKEAADKFLANEEYKNKVAVIVAVYDKSENKKETKTFKPFFKEETAWTALIADATLELEKAIEEGKIGTEEQLKQLKAAFEEAAKTGKLSLTTMELDGKIIYYSLPEKKVEETSLPISLPFLTEELAQAALEAAQKSAEEANAKLDGTTTTIENATIVKNDGAALQEILEVDSLSTILPDVGYYTIKNGNTVVVWTSNALEEDVQKTLETSIKASNKDAIVKFVSGYNKEEEAPGVGKFTFKKEKKSYTTTCPSFIPSYLCRPTTVEYDDYSVEFENESEDNIYAYGIIVPGVTYTLSYTLKAVTETWSFDKNIVTLGFDYYVDGAAEVHTRSLFQVQSILAGKIYDHTMAYRVNTTNTYTSYVASFDIYKEEVKTKATVAYKITKEKAATGGTGPSEEDNNNQQQPEQSPVIPEEDNEGTGTVLPPNTGVQVNFFMEGALLISILVAAASLKKLCK